MTSRSELLGAGFDPDDLAVVLCAIIRGHGLEPFVNMSTRIEGDYVVAIDVSTGSRRVASFHCYPMRPSVALEQQAKIIADVSANMCVTIVRK